MRATKAASVVGCGRHRANVVEQVERWPRQGIRSSSVGVRAGEHVSHRFQAARMIFNREVEAEQLMHCCWGTVERH
jgi:hypothetical protein